uniref:Cilia- and flagella-associated protein 300 n=1 Tax=Scophthalmus maximus TaxID=52904 RepID=A0A8D3BM89_SCOMX
MAGEKSAFDQTFSFSSLPSKKFSFLQDKDTLALLMKWSMLGRISAQSYSFDQSFCPYNSENLWNVFDFCVCVCVCMCVCVCVVDKPVVSVDVELVPCTKVSMELFDPIYSCGILRPSGHIVKCFHYAYPDYDELRQMLQEEDSEHYDVVRRGERGEFLFRLFKHLCLGGELCQYEDTIDPYINTTKQVYKDLISAQKDPDTKKISVVSTVIKVSAYDEFGRCFPGIREQEQTFAYLIVDPFKRHVTLFCHFYGVGNLTL